MERVTGSPLTTLHSPLNLNTFAIPESMKKLTKYLLWSNAAALILAIGSYLFDLACFQERLINTIRKRKPFKTILKEKKRLYDKPISDSLSKVYDEAKMTMLSNNVKLAASHAL
jgi:hypothetical protein